MNVELSPDQRAFVQKAIESGRFTRQEQAIEEALTPWEERERRRLEIIAMVEEADASCDIALMAHRLSLRARSDVDDIAYYVSVEGRSLEAADRLLESIYRQ
jgi:Arc/MetJ-type ribon-helix-helix transcriptional regulator